MIDCRIGIQCFISCISFHKYPNTVTFKLINQLSFKGKIEFMSEQKFSNPAISDISTSLNRYGIGSISIDSIDNPDTKDISNDDSSLSSLSFSSGYGASICHGTLHLLKQPFAFNVDEQVQIHIRKDGSSLIKYPKGIVYAILSIPSIFSPIDFIKWLGGWVTHITHFRFIRDGSEDRYICLAKFQESSFGSSFSESMQGKPYSSFHSKQCYIVPIHSVEIISNIVNSGKMTIIQTFGMSEHQFVKKNGKKSASIVPLETGWIELPTCPVCLERIDKATTGIMTTFCHHTFHCECLSKWEGIQCPVCRYSSSSPSLCSLCSSTKNLWICLICGNIGCGRYQRAHAYEHFLLTDHIFALDLSTQRVWDYVGDRYVHRLYQNKDDGKLLYQDRMNEMENEMILLLEKSPDSSSFMHHDISYPVTSLFSIQLESQKDYFQTQIESLHIEYHEKMQNITIIQESNLLEKDKEINLLREQLDQYQLKINELHKYIKEKTNALEEEHMISNNLHQVIKKLTQQSKEKQVEIEELSCQLSDLYLHLQAQEKITSAHDSSTISLIQSSLIDPGTIQIIDKKKKSRKNR